MNDIQMSLPLTVGAWSMSMMPENDVRIADNPTKRAIHNDIKKPQPYPCYLQKSLFRIYR